ncbi:MAG: hypothetical protein PQJ46_05970 [Spirochaetales bacterium]|nr:hypothetical protein [Spirochaetales bacterium]
MEAEKIRPCNPRSAVLLFNSFRSEWTFRNFIIKPDAPVDTDKMKKELEDAIELFEQMLLP